MSDNKAAVPAEHVINKIVRVIWGDEFKPTAEEIIEAVEEMQRDAKRNNELDKAKQVRGWKRVKMCTGCGTKETVEQILDRNPTAVSCCPERQMISTMVPANYGSNEAEALEGIKNIIWGREARPHLDDLVESVAGLKISNRDYAEENGSLIKENHALKRDAAEVSHLATMNEATQNFLALLTDTLHVKCAPGHYPEALTALHDVIDNSSKKSAVILELQKDLDRINRLLNITNGAIDNLVEMVGAKDPGDLRDKISGMMDRCRVLDEANAFALTGKVVFLPADLEAHTADLITTFSENLAQRLHEKQRFDDKFGWERDEWRDECLRRLHTAEKPIDVAAYAVFAWYHDWAGSYEALVTMPGEFHLPPATAPVNVTVNVSLPDINEVIRQALADRKSQDEGPVGFRTE